MKKLKLLPPIILDTTVRTGTGRDVGGINDRVGSNLERRKR